MRNPTSRLLLALALSSVACADTESVDDTDCDLALAQLEECYAEGADGLCDPEMIVALADDCENSSAGKADEGAGAALYNYPRFSLVPMLKETAHVSVGELFPDGTVYNTNGLPLELSTLWVDKPVVIESISNSCAIAASKSDAMDTIAKRYGDQVYMLALYTREAHPGHLRQHKTLEEKIDRAKEVAFDNFRGSPTYQDLARSVVVDDLEGTLHSKIGEDPNSVYVIDTDGVVVMYSKWNQPDKVDAVMDLTTAISKREDAIEDGFIEEHPDCAEFEERS